VPIRHFLLASALLVSQLTLQAQSAATVSDLKAAYLYQFGHYVAWPAMPHDQAICVLGDAAVVEALEALARDDVQAGRISIRRASADEAGGCDVLFLGQDEPHAADIIKGLEGRPTLTVGDGAPFLRDGGMIAFIEQGQKIRFSVNLRAAQAAHLRVSSELLKLAIAVIR
jgi:hypothetical protein